MKISDITKYGIESYGIDTLLYTADELDRIGRKLNMAIGRAIPKDKRDVLDTDGSEPLTPYDIMQRFNLGGLFHSIASARVDELGPKACLEHNITVCVNEKMRPGESVVIKGKLDFSRLAKHIDGEELERYNYWAEQRSGVFMNHRPFTQVTLSDAELVFANPDSPTWEEIYVQQHMLYTSKSKQSDGKTCATLTNKSSRLPHVGVLDNGVVNEVKLERELDRSLNTIVTAYVFNGYKEHRGVSLDWVIVDKLRYYPTKRTVPPALAVETAKAFA